METPSKSCLDVTSGNEVIEKNVAGNDPNDLASSYRCTEIHTGSYW